MCQHVMNLFWINEWLFLSVYAKLVLSFIQDGAEINMKKFAFIVLNHVIAKMTIFNS
jgi:hypothetical protein